MRVERKMRFHQWYCLVFFTVYHALLRGAVVESLKFTVSPFNPGVNVGENVSLVWNYHATASELAYLEIRWGLSRDGSAISDVFAVQASNQERKINVNINPRYAGRVRVLGNATLQIINVTEDDDAFYSCELNGLFAMSRSPVHLSVFAPPSFIRKSPSIIEGIEGRRTELACEVKGIPLPQVEWTKDGVIIASGRGVKNIFLDPLAKEDAARYVCKAFNKVRQIKYSVDLTVLYRPTNTRLLSNVPDRIVNEGGTLKLNCETESNPRAAFLIYHKAIGSLRQKLLTNSTSGAIVLENISPKQSGTYICIPYNKVDNGAPKELVINVKYPPRFSTKPPSTRDVLKGLSLELRCEAQGFPKPTVKWIHKESGRVETVGDVLYMNKVGIENHGKYICQASNGLLPDASTEMQLNVLYKPEIDTSLSSDRIPSWIGNSVELKCLATGNPPPTYMWKSHGLVIPEAYGLSVLKVTPRGTEDFGLYTCNVSNSIGMAELTITLYEVSKPSQVMVSVENIAADSVTMNLFVKNDGGSKVLHYIIEHNETQVGWKPTTLSANDNNIYKVTNLVPDTTYTLRVTASNGFFFSAPFIRTVRTKESYPGIPAYIHGIAVNSTTLRVQWSPPLFPNGKITKYIVKYGYTKTYAKTSTIQELLGDKNMFFTIVDLTPNAKMSFQVQAFTSVGPGNFSEIITATTEHSAPSAPINPHVKKMDSQSVTLSWGIPVTLNGFVAKFNIEILWRDLSSRSREFKSTSRVVQALVVNKFKRSIGLVVVKQLNPYRLVDINDLRPYSDYEFRVQEGTGNGNNKILWGPFSEKATAQTPETAPSRPQDVEVEAISETGLLITWLRPDFPNGKIRKYSIEYSNRTAVKYFADITSGLDNSSLSYLLKGLAKQSTYSLRIRAYTVKAGIPSRLVQAQTGGTGGAGAVASTREPPSNPAMPIFVGVVAGIVAFAFIIIILGLVIKKRRALKEANLLAAKQAMISSDSGIVDKESVGTTTEYNNPPHQQFSKTLEGPMSPGGFRQGKAIPVAELREYCIRNHTNNNKGFIDEFRALLNSSNFTWEHSKKNENKPKNRYQNVMAYDHTRVVLTDHEGSVGTDYINANYIDGYQHANKFIATQGPVAATFNDFWRMTWEQKSPIIVMITNIIEKGRIKCQKYWPTAEPEQYGEITVTPLEELELADYTIRKFALQLTAPSMKHPTREVTQFHFTSWPDHGVPTHATGLLAFLRRVRNSIPENSGPIVTHCSAGVGRTGTFIVLDAMFDQIIAEGVVDIFGFVNHIRTQRNLMVQSELQYMFMYDALLEAITCGNTEIPVHELRDRIKSLNQIDPETGQTQMAQEFKNLDMDPDDVKDSFTSALLPENKIKNRNLDILPYESSRVKLWPYPGLKGSDYINSSFIDGYQQREAYLATQAPLEDTIEDFWRMTWEYESYVVVMLTGLTENGETQCPVYWPEKDEEFVVFGLLMVEIISEEELRGYIRREFKITNTKSGEVRTVFHFWFTEWPKDRVPDSSIPLIDMIGQVTRAQQVTGNGSISVHCTDGSGRTGAFCTISICIERLKLEGTVDMFQTVRSLRSQRPGMVQTLEQYRFCYNTVMQFVDNFTDFNNFK